MSLVEIFGEPTPEYEVWTATQWSFSIATTAFGLFLVSFWPQSAHALSEINDRVSLTRWIYVPLVVIFGLFVLVSVVYAVVLAPWQMPRAMDANLWVRMIPGFLSVAAGIRCAILARRESAPGTAVAAIVLTPMAFAAIGLLNDYLSRVAAGIPIAVTVLYAGGIVGVLLIVFYASTNRR